MAKEYIIFEDKDIEELLKGNIVTVKQKSGEDLHFKYKPVMMAQMTAPVSIQNDQPIQIDRSIEAIISDINENMLKQMDNQIRFH